MSEERLKEIISEKLDEVCSTLDEIREALVLISGSLAEIAKK